MRHLQTCGQPFAVIFTLKGWPQGLTELDQQLMLESVAFSRFPIFKGRLGGSYLPKS